MENVFYSTGRRKESTARVFLSRGTGKITVNSDPLEKYFGRETNIMLVKQALKLTETLDTTDLKITVKGGGSTGQAGAIKLGISRALLKFDEMLTFVFKPSGPVPNASLLSF
jgi:small subunit ribosomal protein S9